MNIYILVLTFVLIGCSKPPAGTYNFNEIICLKSETNSGLGLSTSGNMVVTSTTSCVRAECFEITRVCDGQSWFCKDNRGRMLPIHKCVKDD